MPSLDAFMASFCERNPHMPTYTARVHRALTKLWPFLESHPDLADVALLTRLCEPERVFQCQVCWHDDDGQVRVNRAWRVQYSSALGPYKGGLRFTPGLTTDVLHFLAFEQTLKNSLTGLPMGAGKGGADFDPSAHSDAEVMRFCQALMRSLWRHLGAHLDIPAGDQGVGAREVGYLFGAWRALSERYEPAFTGKPLALGGVALRAEATGHGCVYFARELLAAQRDRALADLRCVVSGAGNVALNAAAKLLACDARVLALSDSGGRLTFDDGLTPDLLERIRCVKQDQGGALADLADASGCTYDADAQPWDIPCDLAFPCATQDELDVDAAHALINNDCIAVIEGANGPTTPAARDALADAGVLLGPDIAANAGGVAVSGFEITQNLTRQPWSADEVDAHLQQTMRNIHAQCVRHGHRADRDAVDHEAGAVIAGFKRVATAMRAAGVL